jgi:hypothetical protein
MAKEHLGRYANTLDCLGQVLRQEGLSALFLGLSPTLIRNCVWNAIFYGSTYEIEKRLQPLDSGWAAAGRGLAVGTGVGVCATVFNAPFDVVKSRFQSQLPGERKYARVVPTLITIAREEGPLALYKGGSMQGGLRGGRGGRHAFTSAALSLRTHVPLQTQAHTPSLLAQPPIDPPNPGFLPKSLRLGIGQSVGLLTFTETLKALGVAHGDREDAAEGRAAALIAD